MRLRRRSVSSSSPASVVGYSANTSDNIDQALSRIAWASEADGTAAPSSGFATARSPSRIARICSPSAAPVPLLVWVIIHQGLLDQFGDVTVELESRVDHGLLARPVEVR